MPGANILSPLSVEEFSCDCDYFKRIFKQTVYLYYINYKLYLFWYFTCKDSSHIKCVYTV